MEPALGTTLLWLAFAGTHIGLSTRRVRAALVTRFGEWGYVGLFSLVAAVTFAALIHSFAVHRFEGMAGPAVGRASDTMHIVLLVVAFAGMVLALASLVAYPASPYALGTNDVRAPRGLERVTRHPFFAGLALLGAAHALLATRLVGAVFFAILAGYALLGAWHQDRRFLATRGEPYARYLATTSMLPFVAIVAGRQRLVWRELPWPALAGTVLAVVALRLAHESLLAANGTWLIGVVVGGAAVATLPSWLRHVRRAAEPRRSPRDAGERPPLVRTP